ncbi:hypothetical protein WJX81_004078 [Elliptochloris bilobata]|uniref:Uncharacterized protein n=1 Tax=Elliptochloris bilobata TaxID=381761 RepID=A0AAW1RTQ3_9CHLO
MANKAKAKKKPTKAKADNKSPPTGPELPRLQMERAAEKRDRSERAFKRSLGLDVEEAGKPAKTAINLVASSTAGTASPADARTKELIKTAPAPPGDEDLPDSGKPQPDDAPSTPDKRVAEGDVATPAD